MQSDGISPVYEVFYIESMLFNTRHAANSIMYLLKVIDELDGNEDPKRFEKLDEERILNHVQNILLQGAALSRYFWPVRDAHKSRGESLRASLAVSDESPLKNRDLRNAVEHFDERIDKYLANGIHAASGSEVVYRHLPPLIRKCRPLADTSMESWSWFM